MYFNELSVLVVIYICFDKFDEFPMIERMLISIDIIE